MRIADFIDSHVEAIVSAAEVFAATLLPAASHLNPEELRDHLPMILAALAKDLRTPQTADEEILKSEGRAPRIPGAPETAAQTHALLRAKSGFEVEQLVAEYRALRASVLRLWAASGVPLNEEAFADVIRFNEAIDQAVAESVAFFTTEVDRWRHVFLGVLGHDLRGPLNAILITSQLLSAMSTEAPVTQHAARLIRSGERMKGLLDDLLDYSRASLGLGIAIHRAPVDLASACDEELELLRSALPGRTIEYCTAGTTVGNFDASRVREVLSNLVLNAAAYGTADSVIQVSLAAQASSVTLSVENFGLPIAAQAIEALFEPLRRGAAHDLEKSTDRANLGLGLFIVREVARAHGGDVQAASLDGRTTFTITLPSGEGQESPSTQAPSAS